MAGLHAGALLIWTLLSLAAAVIAPGFSYLFIWPVLVVALAALLAGGHGLLTAKGIAMCLAALVTAALLIPIAYLIGAVFLGVTAAGGIVTAAIIALIAWLLVPLLETLCDGARWSTPLICAAAAIVLVGIGVLTVRTSDVHPVPSRLIYAIDADSSDAWLASRASAARTDAWTRTALAPFAQGPEWIAHFFLSRPRLSPSACRLFRCRSLRSTSCRIRRQATRGNSRCVCKGQPERLRSGCG